ncbi:hypothetical protein D3C75_1375310 [compost metagenome]
MALTWPRVPRALRTKLGRAWAKVLAAMAALKLVLAGNPGASCATRRSRLPFRS